MKLIDRRKFIRDFSLTVLTVSTSLVDLTACNRKGVQNIMPSPNTMLTTDSGITLDSQITREAKGLRVAYTIANNSGGEIGIFNRIPLINSDGTMNAALQPAYIDLDDTELDLRAMELPLPEDGIQIAVRLTPYAVQLLNQKTFKEEFFLPTPIVVYNPYKQITLSAKTPVADIVADDLRQANKVKLSVGVFKSIEGLKFTLVSSLYPEVYRIYPATYQQIVLTQSASLDEPLAVKDYRAVPRT